MENTDVALRASENTATAKQSFLWSLGIGTALEASFLLTEWDALMMVGFFYLIIVLLFNLIIFINNVMFICMHKDGRMKLLGATLLLLLNIPIAIAYILIPFNH